MKIDIRPSMDFYLLMENLGYSLEFALAEYIDNALQAFIDHKEQLNTQHVNVKIKIFSNDYHDKNKSRTIIISDDGPGIKLDKMQDVFSRIPKASKNSLNEFGIGLKTASYYFTKRWSLKSIHYNEPKTENIVDIDLIDLNIEDQYLRKIITLITNTIKINFTPKEKRSIQFLQNKSGAFILNSFAHGEGVPTKDDIDDLLKNTQALIKLIYSYEHEI